MEGSELVDMLKTVASLPEHVWLKNGDHPLDYASPVTGLENGEIRTWTGNEVRDKGWEGQIVRYFRHPEVPGDRRCKKCDHILNDHGWIDQGPEGLMVCPGNAVVGPFPDGTFALRQA